MIALDGGTLRSWSEKYLQWFVMRDRCEKLGGKPQWIFRSDAHASAGIGRRQLGLSGFDQTAQEFRFGPG
jgi:hypothetical protein